MDLLIRKTAKDGFTSIVRADGSALRQVNFALLTIREQNEYVLQTENCEWVGIILGGLCDIRSSDFGWKRAGGRESVFGGKATAFYLPPNISCTITARTNLSIAFVSTEVTMQNTGPIFIESDEVLTRREGRGNFARENHYIFDRRRFAGRLLVGETFVPPGHWSSYPPHRHQQRDLPQEDALEEVFMFLFDPPAGFGYVHIYEEDREKDTLLCVRDGDTVMVPDGYHTITTAPGYRMYYLWAISGENREIKARIDPRHSWVQ